MSGIGAHSRTRTPPGSYRVECPDCGVVIAVVFRRDAIWAALRNHTCRTPATQQPRGNTMSEAPILHAVPSGKRPHPRELVNHADARIRRAAQKVVDAVAHLDEVWAENAEKAELRAEKEKLRQRLAEIDAELRGTTVKAAPKHDPKAIRAWAAANGHDVAPSGMLPRSIVEAYQAANGGAA